MNTLLQAVFDTKPEDSFILVWSLQGKKSQWFKSIKSIKPENFTGDTYIGMGTSPLNYGPSKRCNAAKINGIGALWLDIDILGDAHKKGNLPATQVEALKLLSDCMPEPSYIIDSGHGLQAYWLLTKWQAIDDTNRSSIQALLIDFNALWRRHCAASGYDADSVCDLARVMRLPGSRNHKVSDDIRQVAEIKAKIDLRYEIAQLRQWTTEHGVPPSAEPVKKEPATKKDKPLSQKPKAISDDRLEALFDIDHRIKETWDKCRKDMKDQSGSSYTIAIGRFAHNAGWTDQEVYDLMYEFRVRHGLEPKPHALALTLERIKQTPSGKDNQESTKQDVEIKDSVESLEQLGEKLELKLERFIRFASTPPAYALIIDGQFINIGTIDNITEVKKFRNNIAQAIGILPKRYKPAMWDVIVSKLLSFVEHDTAGKDSTEEGQCIEWIQAYLHNVIVHKDKESGLKVGEPWIEDDQAILIATALRGWLAINLQERIDSRKLCLILRSIGAEPLNFNGRNVWRIPRKVWEPK